MSEVTERTRRFEELRERKPNPGELLYVKEGGNAPVMVDTNPVKVGLRVMFCNAAIDEECTGWYLTRDGKGLKCLILPQSQNKLLERNGGVLEGLTVRELRVVRHARNGRALICEIIGK